MASLRYAKPDRVSIKHNPELDERWVQQIIAEDPSVLGLGDIVLKDKERLQPQGGRLDLLFQDADTNRRYEVEIQLGKTDETHIIRTIEYWDVERKRYPQYDHTAVIVAEEITSRFLNVIALFNGFIPLIALQMQALKIGENISLVFTTVLSEMRLGLLDEGEEGQETTDRAYWENRASKATVAMADELLRLIHSFDSDFVLKYNKFYIGLQKNGQVNNFIALRPKKDWLRIEARLERSDELQTQFEEAGLDLMEYDPRSGRYRIRLAKGDIQKHEAFLKDFLKKSYDVAGD